MNLSAFLIIKSSKKSVKTIIDQAEQILKAKSVTVFARIDHAKAAKEVGLQLADEEVLIFGNPKVGTALMVEQPAIGIELPLKIVAWQDKQETKVAYQDLDQLAKLFNLQASQETVKLLKTFMDNFVQTICQ